MADIDFHNMSDAELESVRRDMDTESNARYTLKTVPDRVDTAISDYQTVKGRVPGGEWQKPSSGLEAYTNGAIVTHQDETWVSTEHANIQEPGVSGWKRSQRTMRPLREWKAPGEGSPAYSKGERVLFDGRVYESTADDNYTEPTGMGAFWNQVNQS